MVMVSQTESSVTKLSSPDQTVIHNTLFCSDTAAVDGQAPSAAAQDRTIGDSWMMFFPLGSKCQRGRVQENEYSPLPRAGNASASRRNDASIATRETEQQPSSFPFSVRPSSSTALVGSLSAENGCRCRPRNTDGTAHGSRGSASGQRSNQRLLPLPTPQASFRSCRSCSSLDDHRQHQQHQLLPLSTVVPTTSNSAVPNTRPISPVLGGCGSGRVLSDRDATAGQHQENGGSHSAPCSPSSPRPRLMDSYLYLYSRLPKVTCDVDLDRLSRSMYALQEGRFYFKGLDSLGARDMLQNTAEGTFLVRDSMDPKFLYSITVKTSKGATSVRIRYHQGFFQLDCEDEMRRKLPRFETMLDLLDFHVAVCRENRGSQYRWLESSRCKDMVVRLTTPLRHSPPSLGHQARMTVNRTLKDLHLPSRSTDLLPLAPALKTYLRLYAYKI